MTITHFIKVRFDKRSPAITKEWLDYRYAFFIRWTLESLRLQTHKNWILWINFQDGMQTDAKSLINTLEDSGLNYVVTFGDDPVEPGKLDPYGLGEHLRWSDYVYVTRIDSDDLYSNDALKLAIDVKPTRDNTIQASMFRRGYMYDMKENKLGVYDSPSTPFHTLMIPGRIFRDRHEYKRQVWDVAGDHSRVNSAFYTHELDEFKFTVLIHDKNFASDFDYSHAKDKVPCNWTIKRFLNPPVVFDLDDFCDKWNVLPQLARLKEAYPKFKCTLFTIPGRTSLELLKQAHETGYIELCPHGVLHEPNEELRSIEPEVLVSRLKHIDTRYYTKGFRPPGWYMNVGHVKVLAREGYWVAFHKRDIDKLSRESTNGYYCCDDRLPYWHGHTHNVCGNWIVEHLEALLKMWPKDQEFSYVSDATLVDSA